MFLSMFPFSFLRLSINPKEPFDFSRRKIGEIIAPTSSLDLAIFSKKFLYLIINNWLLFFEYSNANDPF